MEPSVQIETLIRTDFPELGVVPAHVHEILYRRVGVMMPMEAYSLISSLPILFPSAMNIAAMQFALWGVTYRLDEPTSGHCLRVSALLDWMLENEGSFDNEINATEYFNRVSIFGSGIIHDVLKVLFAQVLNGLTKDKAKKELIPGLKVSHTGPLPYWLASVASYFEINSADIVLPSVVGTMHHMPHYPRRHQMIILPTLEHASLNEDIVRSHLYLTTRLGSLQSRNQMKRSAVTRSMYTPQLSTKELAWIVAASTVADNFDALSSSRPYREGDDEVSWEVKKTRAISIINGLPPVYRYHVDNLLQLVSKLEYLEYRNELLNRSIVNMKLLFHQIRSRSPELARYLLDYLEIRDNLLVPGRVLNTDDLENIIRNILTK